MKKLILSAFFTGFILTTSSVSAVALTEPVNISNTKIFSDIYNTGTNVQYLIVSRVDLPQTNWHTYLNDQTDCTTQTVVNCQFPGTLSSTLATIGLYKSGDPTLVSNEYGTNYVERYRVIGDQFFGLNLDVLPEGKTAEQLANDGSQICVLIYSILTRWNGTTMVMPDGTPTYYCDDIEVVESIDENADQRAELKDYIAKGFFDIEVAQSYPRGTLITNTEKVTSDGVPMARRISDLLQQQLPDLFAVGLVNVFGTPVPSQTSTLETYFQNQANSSTIQSAFAGVGKQYFGMSGGLLAGSVMGTLAIITGAGIYLMSGNSTAGLTFGFTTAFVAGFWLIPSWVMIFLGVLFILSVLGIAWIIKKIPT
tara:strand:+ start:8563 stop:9663 length:1101 start_codon:yes stop_codon:yes gene_type:complete